MLKCFCSIFLLSLLFPLATSAQSSLTERVQAYVDKYKDIAIAEMEKSGIPASIKLAQAIHESAFGTSELAKNAKNHFGIKCANWSGPTYYKQDDEKHKSCFRVYKDPEESFRDHTEFLSSRSHYDFLFDYESTDYKHWARGLRKAGYATDPKYASKIIKTIETYELAQYDQPGAGEETEEVEVQPFQAGVALREKTRSFLFRNYKKGIFNRNKSAFFVAKPGETALAAATRMGIPFHRFLKFNDLQDGDVLINYQYCFIQPKKKSFHGEEDLHEVENDERMYEIAQFYGIDLDHLYKLNQLKEGQEPENGEVIYLKRNAPNRPKLRPQNHQDLMPLPIGGAETPVIEPEDSVETVEPSDGSTANSGKGQDTLELNTPTYPSGVYEGGYINTTEEGEETTGPPTWVEGEQGNTFPEPETSPTPNPTEPTEPNPTEPTEEGTPPPTPTEENTAPSTPPTEPEPQMHVVQSGEGLWGIAREYDLTVDELKAFNSLNSNTLKVGQVLRIPSKESSPKPPEVEAPEPQQPETANTNSYTVQSGDSLWGIANKFGISVDALKKANNMTNNSIQPGMKLVIPK